ncbi:MAG TPA: PqqD family protein [Anaerolineae bacterium]|nr:PqqD family protein [Anaerolineae bacterium]
MILPQQIKIAPNIIYQELDDEVVLLNLSNEHYYGLDEVGVRLWKLTEQGASIPTIVQTLLQEYDVSTEQLEQDLHLLIQNLEAEGLISIE